MPFSLYAAQQAQAVSSGEIWVGLIRVIHPDLATMRFAIESEPVVSRGETYTPWVADFVVPDSVPGEQAQGQIVLDAVDQTILDGIDSLEGHLTIDLEIVLKMFADDVMRDWLSMRLESISMNGTQIAGALHGSQYANELAPWLRFVPQKFPALFR